MDAEMILNELGDLYKCFHSHISPAVAFPSTSQLQPNAQHVAHFWGNCQQTYLGLKWMSCREDHLCRFDGAKLCQQGVMKDTKSLWLLIIMKKAFHTVWRAMGPPLIYTFSRHACTYAGASLKVSLSQMRAVAVFASECQLLLVNSRVLGDFAHSLQTWAGQWELSPTQAKPCQPQLLPKGLAWWWFTGLHSEVDVSI